MIKYAVDREEYGRNLSTVVGPEYGVNAFTLNMAGEHRLKDENMLTIMQKVGKDRKIERLDR